MSLRKSDTGPTPIESEFEILQVTERLPDTSLRWFGTIKQQETTSAGARELTTERTRLHARS